ncbi:MAG: hypothetical protein VB062_04285 [Christensenella sp.]|nr:hypothetical protein [Christensenella sp.]
MKKLGESIHKLYRSERARWLFSLLAALALLGIAALLSTISYYDNDDLNIAWALAGYRTGTPSFAHPFINCLMAIVTSALYTILPRVPWWLVLQLIAIMLGMTAVFASALKIGARHRVPLILVLALIVALGAGLFFYGIVLVTFTLSATVAGAGAVALALSVDAADEKNLRRRYLIGMTILLAGSLLIRNSSGIAAACFVLGALIYRAWESRRPETKPLMKQCLVFFAIAVAVTAALVGSNAYGREAQNPEGFVAYDEARSAYMDYPRDSIAQNPEAYAEAGWDGTLAAMTSVWFYMDERVTTEAFRTIAERSSFAGMGIAEKFSFGASALGTFFKSYPLAVYYGVLAAAAYGAALLLAVIGRKRWTPLLGASAFLAGAGVLVCYLLAQGRINLRVWMTVSTLTGVAVWLCALSAYDMAEGEKHHARLNALRAGVMCVAILASIGVSYKVFRTVASYEDGTPDLLAASRAVTSYAISHPGNVYIRDVYAANNVDALSVYPETPPTNLIDWGGCDMNTITRVQQLAVNNLESTWAKDLFRLENVYYIGDQTGQYLPMMVDYMEQHCGATGYEVVDSITGGVVAVRFLFEAAQ